MNLLELPISLPGLAASRSAARIGIVGATAILVGALASGPFAQVVVALTHPQPPWTDARTFAAHYHPVQALPFLLGFLLVAGFVLLIASLHTLAGARLRTRTQSAVLFTAVFAAMILFNYAVQTTLVPGLALRGEGSDGPLLGALTMNNPVSLGWSLEMWGYGWLGVATWLVAPVFDRGRLERATRAAFVLNGPLSMAAAFWTAVHPGWVMTSAGWIAFAAWNALVVAMAVLALLAFRNRTLTHLPDRGSLAR